MTALTQDRQTPRRASHEFVFPVAAATKIFGGSLVCLNATGYATKGATSTTLKCVGMADGMADNSAGANGDIRVKVKRGCYKFANSASTDQIDRFNQHTGLEKLAHFPDLDIIRRSRLKKSTLFEMEPTPELVAVQEEYLQLAARLWLGTEPLAGRPMKDRELFDFLGYE